MAAATEKSGVKKKQKHETKALTCSLCSHEMEYHYYGNKPPFAKSLMLLEECYIMKDPFSTTGGLIVVGSVCTSCQKVVCLSSNCSLFYSKRFCIPCVLEHIAEFPEEIQEEVSRRQKQEDDS